jgi:hypothetical protein
MAKETKATLEAENLDAVADRGQFSSGEILACDEAGITVTLPKPMTSRSKAEGRFGKQDCQSAFVCASMRSISASICTISCSASGESFEPVSASAPRVEANMAAAIDKNARCVFTSDPLPSQR